MRGEAVVRNVLYFDALYLVLYLLLYPCANGDDFYSSLFRQLARAGLFHCQRWLHLGALYPLYALYNVSLHFPCPCFETGHTRRTVPVRVTEKVKIYILSNVEQIKIWFYKRGSGRHYRSSAIFNKNLQPGPPGCTITGFV